MAVFIDIFMSIVILSYPGPVSKVFRKGLFWHRISFLYHIVAQFPQRKIPHPILSCTFTELRLGCQKQWVNIFPRFLIFCGYKMILFIITYFDCFWSIYFFIILKNPRRFFASDIWIYSIENNCNISLGAFSFISFGLFDEHCWTSVGIYRLRDTRFCVSERFEPAADFSYTTWFPIRVCTLWYNGCWLIRFVFRFVNKEAWRVWTLILGERSAF